MPVALFPNVAFPRVQVTLDAGDRPADQMAIEVTTPVEEAVRRVRGVRDVRSTTSRGSADIAVTFDWGADMAAALQEVNAAAGQILPQLPAGTQLETRRMDPTTFPVLAYSLRSHTLSPSALHDLAEYQLRPLLSGINGVAQVGVQGGEVAEFHADVDPDKLRALDLSLADVSRAVSQAATHRRDGPRLRPLQAVPAAGRQPAEDDRRAGQHRAARLGPTAWCACATWRRVRLGHVPQWIKVNADGQNAVLLQVYQQPDGNSVQIASEVKQRLADFAPQMPAGVTMANWYDQTQLVTHAAGSVRDAILIGIVLAGLVLFVFLRNTRVILIALIVVPAVLAITVLLLRVLGHELQHDDAGRHGRRGRADHRRRDRDARAHHAPARRRATTRPDARAHRRRGVGVHPPADRLQRGHGGDLPAAGLPVRRHRRVLQGAVADHGQRADHLLPADLDRGAAAGRALPGHSATGPNIRPAASPGA